MFFLSSIRQRVKWLLKQRPSSLSSIVCLVVRTTDCFLIEALGALPTVVVKCEQELDLKVIYM